MTISSEITKLINNLAACYTKCTNKGATIPQDENFDNLADCINSIPVANLTSLSVTPSTTAQTLTPSSPYNGFNQVDVSAINLQNKYVTIDSPYPTSITPDSGYDGLSSVDVILNNDNLTVTPSTSYQSFTPASGYSGFGYVNVDAVTAAIDSNITAENIKSGVSILGVSGTLSELNGTTTSITPTTSSQTVTPSSPYNGFTSVTVPAVTSSIDANITAGNIKDGVTILGVVGNYQGSGGNYTVPSRPAYNYIITSTNVMIGNSLGYTATTLDSSTMLGGGVDGEIVMADAITTVNGYVLDAYPYKKAYYFARLSSFVESWTGLFLSLQDGGVIYFESLNTSSFSSNYSFLRFQNAPTGVTVHLPSNLSTFLANNPTVLNGFGGKNTTILFDLQPTN